MAASLADAHGPSDILVDRLVECAASKHSFQQTDPPSEHEPVPPADKQPPEAAMPAAIVLMYDRDRILRRTNRSRRLTHKLDLIAPTFRTTDSCAAILSYTVNGGGSASRHH